MGYAADYDYQPSVLELARSGNFRAIAYWLNVVLLPHQVYAQVSAAKQPGCLKILVEFNPIPNQNPKSPEFRKSMVRFICRHIWKLNSDVIEGVQVVAKYVENPQILWQQSVRVVSPARRAKLARETGAPKTSVQQTQTIKSRIKTASRQRVQFRAMRSLLLTGTTAAAFILGCWFGYSDAPPDQTNASATSATRSDTVMTALEKIPVDQLDGNPNSKEVSLVFGGDTALNEAYSNLVGDDKQWAFSALDEYRQADIAMVNLEAPFTIADGSGQTSSAKMNPENVAVLQNGGIDIVNLANDGTMGYEAAGLQDTLKTLEQAGIRSVGAGLDAKEARRPEILDIKGQRIAYLGYHDATLHSAEATKPGLNAHPSDRVGADIKAIRDQVDWVIVNYHWDENLEQRPSDRQIELARQTIDYGADLVVGHHSAMLQGAEIYKGRPIVYSLGSFIFGETSNSDYDTAVLRVALNDKQMKVEMLPVEVRGFQPRVVQGDRAQEILQKIASASDQFQEPMKSSVVLDTRSNTIVPEAPASPAPESPAATPESQDASPQPTDSLVPSSPTESAPSSETPTPESSKTPAPESSEAPASDESNLDNQVPGSQPSEVPVEQPALNLNSQPAESSTPTTEPSPANAEPAPSPAPEAESVPSSSPSGDSQSEAPKSHPWGDNPFLTDPNAQPSPGSATFGEPMVPQQPVPKISPDHQGDASTAPTQLPSLEAKPSPVHSLEPMKRRYAAHPPSDLAPVSLVPNL